MAEQLPVMSYDDMNKLTRAGLRPYLLKVLDSEKGFLQSTYADWAVARYLTGAAVCSDRTRGLILRELDKMADEGLIVKIRRGTVFGGEKMNAARYYTLERAAEIRRQQDEAAERRAKTEARWDRVRERLAAGPSVVMDAKYQLSLEAWEHLLHEAGW